MQKKIRYESIEFRASGLCSLISSLQGLDKNITLRALFYTEDNMKQWTRRMHPLLVFPDSPCAAKGLKGLNWKYVLSPPKPWHSILGELITGLNTLTCVQGFGNISA